MSSVKQSDRKMKSIPKFILDLSKLELFLLFGVLVSFSSIMIVGMNSIPAHYERKGHPPPDRKTVTAKFSLVILFMMIEGIADSRVLDPILKTRPIEGTPKEDWLRKVSLWKYLKLVLIALTIIFMIISESFLYLGIVLMWQIISLLYFVLFTSMPEDEEETLELV